MTPHTKAILGIITLGLIIVAVVFYLAGALKNGSVRAIFRKYVRVYYSRTEEPFSYWATMILYFIITIGLIACWMVLLSQQVSHNL
jgi:hypothetical protein